MTAAAFLSLTLGIGANLALFSIVDAVLLKTLPIPDPDQLVRIVTSDFRPGEQHEIAVPTHVWRYLRTEQKAFASLLAIATDRVNIAPGGETRYAGCAYVDAEYFDTLQVRIVLGRGLAASDDQPGAANVAVISYSLWQREYSGNDVIGQPMYLDGHRFTIIGVAERGFFGLQVGRRDDVVVPLSARQIIRGGSGQARAADGAWLQVFARLREPADFEVARAALRAWFPILRAATASPDVPADRHLPYAFDLARAAQGQSLLRQQYRAPMTMMLAAVGVLLLIACTNLALLSTARFADRQQEIGVRLSLGASPARVARLVVTDALALSVGASAAAVGIGHALASSMAPLLTFAQGRALATQLELTIDARLVAAAVLLAIATTAVAALAPVIRTTGLSPLDTLGQHVRGGPSRATLRTMRSLASSQVALSIVLFVVALLLIRSFRELTTRPVGVDAEHVMVASVNDPFEAQRGDDYLQRIERTRAALATVPGVTGVSAALVTPLSGLMAGAALHVPGSLAVRPTGLFNYVLPDYFSVVGTPVLIGREFSMMDAPTGASRRPGAAIINRAFANHHFGGFNPIGRVLMVGERPLEIIGVVANARAMSLREQQDVPMAFGTIAQRPKVQNAGLSWVIRANDTDAVRPRLISAFRIIDPRLSVELRTIGEDAVRGVGRERLLAWIASLVAGLGLLITAVGIYGTFSYAVVRRRTEIGVRMALGATRRDIRRLLTREAGRLMAIGAILGIVVATAARHWLQALLFGISATDVWAYLIALPVVTLAAAIATLLPACRASSLAPADTLREH